MLILPGRSHHNARRRFGSGVALSAYRQAVLEDAPALYWPMDETEGAVATDISGNGRHGTINGSPPLGQAGLVPADPGGSMLFTTIANYVSRAHDAGMSLPFTFEFWFSRGSGNTGWAYKGASIGVSSEELAFSLMGGTPTALRRNAVTTNISMANGHLVLVLSATHATIYNNGARILNNHAAATFNHAAALQVGRGLHVNVSQTVPATLNGRAAHVALYPGALSQARAVAHYNAGIGS